MDKEKIIDLLCERVMIHENDPESIRICDKMIELLSQNLTETINFLKDCNEKQILYISEIFEEISYNLKSKEFLNTLYELQAKFPNISMEYDIKMLEDFMEDDEWKN